MLFIFSTSIWSTMLSKMGNIENNAIMISAASPTAMKKNRKLRLVWIILVRWKENMIRISKNRTALLSYSQYLAGIYIKCSSIRSTEKAKNQHSGKFVNTSDYELTRSIDLRMTFFSKAWSFPRSQKPKFGAKVYLIQNKTENSLASQNQVKDKNSCRAACTQ